MDKRDNATSSPPGLLDILRTLSIEEKRAALAWLRSVAKELGCTLDEEAPIAKNFLDFLSGRLPPRSLN